jgi:hypothetical protein
VADLFSADDDDELRASLSASGRPAAPLAVRMRPRTLDEVVGQQHVLLANHLVERARTHAHRQGRGRPSATGRRRTQLVVVVRAEQVGHAGEPTRTHAPGHLSPPPGRLAL